MSCWQFVCLLCFNLWSMQVWASPTSSGLSTRYSIGNADFNPSHLLNYPSSSQQGPARQFLSRNDTEDAITGKNEKRIATAIKTTRIRRTPTGFSARGFHEEVFDRDFGHFSPVKRAEYEKRRPEADAAGFYGDTFSNGFGEFETMKRRYPQTVGYKIMAKGDMIDPRYIPIPQRLLMEAAKRSPEMNKAGFHSDVFNGGFGEFHPMKK